MAETTKPTEDELTERTRLMRVEIDREAMAERARTRKATRAASTDDEEPPADVLEDDTDDEDEDRDVEGDSEDGRAAKALRRRAKRAARWRAARAAGATEDELIPISISSEYPVERYDWWDDERYEEILVHSTVAVDLSRALNGLPFLNSHNAYDTRQRYGRVLNVKLRADGKLGGDLKFSRRPDAQLLRQDYLDGIAGEISVGYKIDPDSITKQQREGKPLQKYINRWMPYEVSDVSVPADPTVGAGRSGGAAPTRTAPSIRVTARNGQESNMGQNDPAAGNGAVTEGLKPGERAEWVASTASKEQQQRTLDIIDIGALASWNNEKIRELIASDKSVETIQRDALAELKAGGANRQPTGKPTVELTEDESKRYSLQNAIRSMVAHEESKGKSRLSSFEFDISQQLERAVPAGIERRGGLLMPTFTRKETSYEIQHRLKYGSMGPGNVRAGLDTTSTKGAELKYTVPGEFLPILRNYMALMSAGATMLGGLEGPIAFPSQNAAGTASWVAENPGSDASDSNLTLTQITLAAKSLLSTTSYSRQLLAQSVIDVDGMVRDDLARIMALALDLGGINGSGASNQPTGILATSGIGSVAGGTNGLTPTYTHLVDLETQVTAANADQWPLSYMVHPTSRGTFKKATVLSNTVGTPVWQKADETAYLADQVQGGSSRIPGELNGYNAWASAQVPNNLTKGSASGICLALIFGAFSQVVIGDWGMMEIIVDPYRLKKQAMIELTAFGMFGVAVKYPAAFAAMKDALA